MEPQIVFGGVSAGGSSENTSAIADLRNLIRVLSSTFRVTSLPSVETLATVPKMPPIVTTRSFFLRLASP